MNRRSVLARFCFVILFSLCAAVVVAESLELPANAIADDTFFVVKLNPAKVDPVAVEATIKAALGEKAGDADGLLKEFKAHHEKFADKGVDAVTVVMRGDPDKQNGPQPVFYAKLKADADRAALEKQVRDDLGEQVADAMEINSDGDFMIFYKKGIELPTVASDERKKLFEEALGESGQAAVAALICTDAMTAGIQRDVQNGAPAGLAAMITNAKWFRMELSLGDEPKAEFLIHTADADAGKLVADGLSSFSGFVKNIAGTMRQGGGALAEKADGLDTLADAMKPEQSAENVAVKFDAKVISFVLRSIIDEQKSEAGN